MNRARGEVRRAKEGLEDRAEDHLQRWAQQKEGRRQGRRQGLPQGMQAKQGWKQGVHEAWEAKHPSVYQVNLVQEAPRPPPRVRPHGCLAACHVVWRRCTWWVHERLSPMAESMESPTSR